jgi:hypothetical protein
VFTLLKDVEKVRKRLVANAGESLERVIETEIDNQGVV